MACGPGVRTEVVRVAIPEPFNVPFPIVVVLSLKATVPVGVPDPVPVTVAVKVTLFPATDGLALDAMETPVFSSITSASEDEVLTRSFTSPP